MRTALTWEKVASVDVARLNASAVLSVQTPLTPKGFLGLYPGPQEPLKRLRGGPLFGWWVGLNCHL